MSRRPGNNYSGPRWAFAERPGPRAVPSRPSLLDHCGNEVHVGDIVVPVHADASVGARHGMVLERASVIELGRTRAVPRFWSRSGAYRVGTSALRVVQAGDERALITPNQAWEHRPRDEGDDD